VTIAGRSHVSAHRGSDVDRFRHGRLIGRPRLGNFCVLLVAVALLGSSPPLVATANEAPVAVGTRIYVVNGPQAIVSVLDAATNSLVAAVEVGTGPVAVALNPAGTSAYVVDGGSNQVSVIDTATTTVATAIPLNSFPLGGYPSGAAVSPDGGRLYVTNSYTGGNDGTVSIIDTASNAIVRTVTVGPSPASVVFNPAGTRAYVTNRGAASMSVVDTVSSSVVATVPLGSAPLAVAVGPGGDRVYVTNSSSSSISVIDAATNDVVATIAVGDAPKGVTVTPDGTRAYVSNFGSGTVSVVDTGSDDVVATIPVGVHPVGVAQNPDGTRIYVTNFQSDSVSAIDPTTNRVVATTAVDFGPVAVAVGSVAFTSPTKATLIRPLNGENYVETTKPFVWAPVPGAQAYALAVGTTLYGGDLMSSGVLPPDQTSFSPPDLPSGPMLHATLLTKIGGAWSSYQAVTFTAAPGKSTFYYPMNGDQNISTFRRFNWSDVPGAQAYILAIGTTRFGTDLFNTGAIPEGTFDIDVPDLPTGKTLYATLLTKANGSWSRYQDISFTAAIGHGVFTYPVNGQPNVSAAHPFTWSATLGAGGYIVAVGTRPYGTDLLNSGILPQSASSLQVPVLPKGKTLYATLLTEADGIWSRYQAITFTVR
jgi:YVTN family beta-propeller protein